MKHVNLDPRLEKKKEEVMEQFLKVKVNPNAASSPSQPAAVETPPAETTSLDNADAAKPESAEVMKERVIERLKAIYDPEIPVNIYDLGLIYKVDINDGFANIDMTLTTPGCPVAQTFPGMVESAVKLVPGISDAVVNLVWEPPWTQSLISEAARLELGLI